MLPPENKQSTLQILNQGKTQKIKQKKGLIKTNPDTGTKIHKYVTKSTRFSCDVQPSFGMWCDEIHIS